MKINNQSFSVNSKPQSPPNEPEKTTNTVQAVATNIKSVYGGTVPSDKVNSTLKSAIVTNKPYENVQRFKIPYLGDGNLYKLKNGINLFIQKDNNALNYPTERIELRMDFRVNDFKISKLGVDKILEIMLNKELETSYKKNLFVKENLGHKFYNPDSLFETKVSGNQLSIKAGKISIGDSLFPVIKPLKDFFNNPRFSQENLEKAKTKLKEKYSGLVGEHLLRGITSNSVMFKDTDEDLSGKDFLKSIENLTIEDVKTHYEKIIKNSTCNVTAIMPENPFNFNEKRILNSFSTIPYTFKNNYVNLTLPEKALLPLDNTIIFKNEIVKGEYILEKVYKFLNPKSSIKKDISFEILSNYIEDKLKTNFNDYKEKKGYKSDSLDSSDPYNWLTAKIFKDSDNQFSKPEVINKFQSKIKGLNICIHSRRNPKEKNAENKLFFKEANTLIDKVINDIITNPISKQELNGFKEFYESKYFKNNDCSYDRVDLIADNLGTPNGLNSVDERLKAIDEITPEDIQKTAIELFKDRHSVYSLQASKDIFDDSKDYLKSLGTVEEC